MPCEVPSFGPSLHYLTFSYDHTCVIVTTLNVSSYVVYDLSRTVLDRQLGGGDIETERSGNGVTKSSASGRWGAACRACLGEPTPLQV